MKQIIENFTAYDLFGRENYEYYARVTGRVLRVQDEWIFSFRYPPPPRGKSAQQNYACKLKLSLSILNAIKPDASFSFQCNSPFRLKRLGCSANAIDGD